MDTEQTVGLHIVYNAFDPTNVVSEELLYQDGKALDHYLVGLPEECDWKIGVNGVPVEPEVWHVTPIAPEDAIAIIAIPRDSKDIWRLIAMVAVAVAAAAIGYFVGGIGGAILAAVISVVGMYLVNVLIPPQGMKKNKDADTYGYDGAKNTAREGTALPVVYGQFRVGGNYVDVFTENVGDDQYLYGRVVLSDGEIDSIVGVPEINEQPITDYKNVEYGFTPGTFSDPINTRFGQAKAPYLRQDKLNTTYTEYTTTGPVDAFEIDFLFPNGLTDINTKNGDKGNFSVSIEIQYAPYGTADWTNPGTTSTATSALTAFSGSSPVNTKFALLVKGVDTIGAINGTATYTVQYSPAGANTWTDYTSFTDTSTSFATTTDYAPLDSFDLTSTYGRFGNQLADVGGTSYVTQYPERYVNIVLPSGSYDFRINGDGEILGSWVGAVTVAPGSGGSSGSTVVTYTDRRTVAIRKTYQSPTLERGRYHIRFRRTVDEDLSHSDWISELHCTSVVEVQHSNVSLQSIATGWYVAKMTDQLNNIPTVTWLVKGVKCDIYDINGNVTATQWTDNPADIAIDMLISSRRGALKDKLTIDWPAYVAWRQYCEDNSFKFNGVMDNMTTLWDSLRDVYRCGRAIPTRVGTKLSVAVDKPTQPCMLFGPGNIYKDTFNISYMSMTDRATEFEVSYPERDDRHKTHTIRIADPDAAQTGQVPKTAQYTLVGVDNFEQAQKEVWYQLYNNRLIRRVITFDAPVESIGLSIGDVALVQHDQVDWGTSGRVESATSTSQITLDRPVEITAGESYNLLIIHSKLERFTCNLTHLSSNTYSISGISNTSFTADQLKRISTNTGDEAAVESYAITSGTDGIITLDRQVTGTTGQIWDVDVIEEKTVTNGAGIHTVLNVSGGYSMVPDAFSNFMFGTVASVKRPFRLKSISGDGYERRTLTFGEYNEFIYSPPETPIPAPTAKPPTYPNHVTGLNLTLEPIRTGTTVTGTLSWIVGDILHYAGVDVYIATNGGDYVFYNTVMNTSTMMIQLQQGTSVRIKVVAFNDRGYRANINTAPVIEQTVSSVAGSLVSPTDLVWTLNRIDYMAKGSFSWTRASASLGNVSPITRIQIQFQGTTEWVDQGVTSETILEVANIPAGTHTVRVRTEDTTGQISDWVPQTFAVTAPVLVIPTFATDGSAMNRTMNTDGSCNIDVQWAWSGNDSDIDGFQVISHQATTNAAYTLGSSTATETITNVAADKRQVIFYGAPCDKWYSEFVRAYKFVHPSFAASGIIYSTAAHPTLTSEFPYQPNADVTFGGDVTGTIGGVPVATIIAGAGDTTPPLIPSGLILSSALIDNPDGTQWVELLAEWAPNTESDLEYYMLAIKEGTGDFIEFQVSKSVSSFYWSVLANTLYTVKIKAVDANLNDSGYSAEVTHTTLADTDAPAAPTSLTALAAITSIFLSWTNPTDADVRHIKVYENSVNDSSTATNITTLTALPGQQGRFTRSGLATGVTKWYWVKAIDISGNASPFSAGISVTTAQVGTGDIAAFSITAAQIAAGTITADKLVAGTLTADLIQSGTSLPGDLLIGTTGFTLQTVADASGDPAAAINSNTTEILPGKILINGSTTLADWRNGSDLTTIEGGKIAANTISANKVTIGLRGLNISGIQFQSNYPTANRIYWSSGTIGYMNDLGVATTATISAGNDLWTGSILYIYWIKGATTLSTTTSSATANATNNIVLATYTGGVDMVVNYGRTIIDGAHITTGTIDADRIKAGTVFADNILVGAGVGNVPLGNIADWASSTDHTFIDGGKIYANSITSAQLTTGTLIATTSQLGDATVTTLKIAGQSVVVPVVTEGTDTAIISSSGTDIVTSATVTVGDDVDGKALVTIFGWIDFTAAQDTGAAIDLYTSIDGAAYTLRKSISAGSNTTGGSTFMYMPFSSSFSIDNCKTISVKMKGRQIAIMGGGFNGSTVRDPTIVIQGAKR
jgi:hypothetical protein